jgi:hypothetical protein
MVGDATGVSGAWTGSGNLSITTTVVNDSHTHGDGTINGLDTSATTTGIFSAARIPTHTGDVTGDTNLSLANNTVGLPELAHQTAGSLIAYSNTSAPALLTPGNAGEILQTNGAGNLPTWVEAGVETTQYVDGWPWVVPHQNTFASNMRIPGLSITLASLDYIEIEGQIVIYYAVSGADSEGFQCRFEMLGSNVFSDFQWQFGGGIANGNGFTTELSTVFSTSASSNQLGGVYGNRHCLTFRGTINNQDGGPNDFHIQVAKVNTAQLSRRINVEYNSFFKGRYSTAGI